MRRVHRLGVALSSIALLTGTFVTSAEAKVSFPVVDCPFSLLPLMHVHPGTIQISCQVIGGGLSAPYP